MVKRTVLLHQKDNVLDVIDAPGPAARRIARARVMLAGKAADAAVVVKSFRNSSTVGAHAGISPLWITLAVIAWAAYAPRIATA